MQILTAGKIHEITKNMDPNAPVWIRTTDSVFFKSGEVVGAEIAINLEDDESDTMLVIHTPGLRDFRNREEK